MDESLAPEEAQKIESRLKKRADGVADGLWHNVLSYRVVDNGEVEGRAPPAPQTGCYVEEVFSRGKAVPPSWNFCQEKSSRD